MKTATSRMVAAMAHELRRHGVSVVGVYPGFTRTEVVVDAFAANPEAAARSGSGAQAATYAHDHGFTDVDGRSFQPFVLPAENRLRVGR